MKRALILLPAFVMTSACSSLGTKFDAGRAKSVRKVALLSVEILQEQPKDALGFSKAGELKNGKMTDGPEFQSMARTVFDDFSTRLKDRVGWRVVGFEFMTQNPEYTSVVKQKMSGLHASTFLGSGGGLEPVEVKGMLNNAVFRGLSHADKTKLAKALGADSYAELVIIQDIHQGWSVGNLTGDAAFSFTSRANLIVYGLDSEEPIWRIQNVTGPESQRSDTLAGADTRVQKLARIGELSAKSSVHKLIETYKVE